MNYQKDREDPRRQKAAEVLNTQPEYLAYYAWPQVFGSTAGPFPGIGGQAMSTFTIEAWFDQKDAILFCGDRMWMKVEDFDPTVAVTGGYSNMRRRKHQSKE